MFYFFEVVFTQLHNTINNAGVIAHKPSFADCVDDTIVTRALGK
jgi:hypothetical protein